MDGEYSVEVSTPEDSAEVTHILEASYGHLMVATYDAEVLRVALPAMTRANPELLRSGTYYVVRSPERSAIGCGGWTAQRPGSTRIEPGLAHLRHFAVDPRWTGRGVGRRLYERCETQARANGATMLDVFASLNAVPFYAALGFRKLEDVTLPMGRGVTFPSVRMRRAI